MIPIRNEKYYITIFLVLIEFFRRFYKNGNPALEIHDFPAGLPFCIFLTDLIL